MFPVLISPRGRIRGAEGEGAGPVARSARSSYLCGRTLPRVFVFHVGGAEDDEKEGASGIEKPTTEEVGSCNLDQGEVVLGRRSAAQDVGGAFATGLAGGGVGVEGAALRMTQGWGKRREARLCLSWEPRTVRC
ncbi:hypothetical protein FIBSPDRAFT_508057 [Athelia psychrophila]|uniref:Uncharacterized protein n=1 Tax=Athelia psychrophila TaxID=1759441 RepID=A0A166JVN8_9AGAM|nr:hypothetical protein FIBSPDRAFT_508057 [Fibularhizoctonia sp. CBS 109695]